MKCPNCERECFGFWKYGPNHACSLPCFRKLIEEGKISKIPPYAPFPELGILSNNKVPHTFMVFTVPSKK